MNRLIYHKHRIERHDLPPSDGNPVVKCWTYERIAKKYNYVRANNPSWLSEVRNKRGISCIYKYLDNVQKMHNMHKP